MNRFSLYIAIIMTMLLAACSDDYIIHEEPQLVVEGWIENDGFPHVIVTTTIPVSEERKSVDEVLDCMVRWAKVSVSDGEREVILTGFTDKSIMPPYIYRTTEMKGEVGKTYTLKVEYKDFVATATTTIPEVVPIKSIKHNKVKGTEKQYTLTLSFDDPEPKGNYYKLFSSPGADGRQFFSTYLGVLSDEVLNPQVDVELYPGHTLAEIEDFNLFYNEGDTVSVRLCSIDKPSYTFWREYGDALSFGRNYLLPYTKNIQSNMKGASGYWCGYGTDRRVVFIGKEE